MASQSLLRVNFASFRQWLFQREHFSHVFILVSHNSVATFCRVIILGSFKCTFINTFVLTEACSWWLEVLESPIAFTSYLIRYARPAPTPATPTKASSIFLMLPSRSCKWKNSQTHPSLFVSEASPAWSLQEPLWYFLLKVDAAFLV